MHLAGKVAIVTGGAYTKAVQTIFPKLKAERMRLLYQDLTA